MFTVYKVVFANEKIYIGQTSQSLEKRQYEHIRDAKYELKKHGHCPKFHSALLEAINSQEIPKWSILELVETIESALIRETYYIELYNSIDSGYNHRTSMNGKGYMDDATKAKISQAVTEHNLEHWRSHPERRKHMSAVMKHRHTSGAMDVTKQKITATRQTSEQRAKTSINSSQRYTDPKKRDEMAIACGGRPFAVYKGDILIGHFISQAECYKALEIPNNGHITRILQTGKGTLYGYRFIYTNPLLLKTDLIEE